MAEKPFVIANWKMKLGLHASKQLAEQIRRGVKRSAQVVLCPSFVSLETVAGVLRGSVIDLGAQDCFWEVEGAFTGEVSTKQLREVGCRYVIIGHSERRQYFGETSEMIHKKIHSTVAAELTPILCVGETFDQRQQGAKEYVLIEQVTKALEGLELGAKQKIIVAYEPVWVIGSGQAVEPDEAELAHQVIRQTLFDLFTADQVNNQFSVIYGGSVDEHNVAAFTSLDHTDGVLVGGASLKATEFLAVVNNA